MAAFRLKKSEMGSMQFALTDNMGVPIPEDGFDQIFQQFHSGSRYFMNLDIKVGPKLVDRIVTPEMIKEYIIARQQSKLIDLKDKMKFKSKERRDVINILADFILDRLEVNNNKTQLMTISAAVVLFPALMFKESGDKTFVS